MSALPMARQCSTGTTALANIEVDPEIYKVNVDGREITCAPAEKLPLAQLYHLF